MVRETRPPVWWGQRPLVLRIRLAFLEIARAEAVREARLAVPKVYAAYDIGKAIGRAEEREACADIADAEATIEGIAQKIAATIRARGAA